MRHIAVAGSSFSGSTVLSLVLGSLPNVMTIGESHWLTEKRIDRSRRGLGNHSPPITAANYTAFNQCRFCRAHDRVCPYLTMEFRAALQADPTDWYRKVAHALGTDILVSSDKSSVRLRELDPTLEHDLLVSFKSPVRAWMSANKEGRNHQGRDLDTYLDSWSDAYRVFLDDHANNGSRLFMRLEAFAESPRDILARTCQLLDLEFADDALEYWEHEHHYIGGNFHVYFNVMKNERQVEITPLPQVTLPDEELEAVAAHAASRRVYERMLDLFESRFGTTSEA